MKQLLSVLILSLVVIPVLTVDTASANNGDYGRGRRNEETLTGWNSHLRFGERDRSFRGDFGNRFVDGGTGTPAPGDPSTPGDPSGNGQSAPLDGGLSLLLIAGLGLGVKKASNQRKAARQQKDVEIPE